MVINMVYYLNPFYPIVKTNKGYEFPENKLVFEHKSDNAARIFERLLHREGISEDELKNVLGEETYKTWIENKILIHIKIDDGNIYSRSMSYYFHKKVESALYILPKKKVLILGCGGIGSHVAWNLTVMGVGTIYLLDFDIVELSNLNRQILYDTTDIGKKKTDVLKEKLNKINLFVNIVSINVKITSKELLEKIVVECNPDVIIKSLDQPLYFPKWLDEVCQKYQKKYIAGILTGTSQMIGPTFLPNKSACYTDFFDVDETKERIAGIGPSLGFVMYQLSGRITEEVFKMLIGKGELLYKNKIVLYDNLMDDEVIIHPKLFVDEDTKKYKNKWDLVNFTTILCIYYLGTIFRVPSFYIIIAALLYTISMPVFMSQSRREAFGHSFVCFCYMVLFNLISNISRGAFSIIDRTALFGLISMLYTFLGLFVFVLAIIETGLYLLKEKWKRRGRMKL